MLDQAHHHSAGEILVRLERVNVLRPDTGHLIETRRERFKIRRRVVRLIVRRRVLPVVRPLRRRHQVRGFLFHVPRTLR